MSIKSKEITAELQKQNEKDYYGKKQWIKDKDINISIFSKNQTVVDSNGLIHTVITYVGITLETEIKAKENRIKIDNTIYTVESVIKERKTVLILKAVD